MRRRMGMALALASALLVGLAAPVGAEGGGRVYKTHLVGELDGTDSAGQGQAVFWVAKDGDSIDFRLLAANIENITMAHIHLAATPGGNGGIVVWLYPSGPPPSLIPGRFQGLLASGSFGAANLTGALAGQSLDALVAALADGRAYVNVHTTAHPAGEIRGNFACRMP